MLESSGRVTVFRVLERATGLLPVAPPQRKDPTPPAGPRMPGPPFGLVRSPAIAADAPASVARPPSPAAGWPGLTMTAPWGEPTEALPLVVITTQPWPEEWWRPAARSAAQRATERPITVVPARVAPSPPPPMAAAASAPAAPAPAARATAAGATAPAAPAPAAPATAAGAAAPSAVDYDRWPAMASGRPTGWVARPSRHRPRPARVRRGLVARLAIVGLGLLVSLVAAEAAARVGRR